MGSPSYTNEPGGATPSQPWLSAAELAESVPSGVLLAALNLQRARAERVAAGLRTTERALLLQFRDEIHRLEGVGAFAARRISALRAGAQKRFLSQLACAAKALDAVAYDLPRAVAAYMIVAFAQQNLRNSFVLHPERREQMVGRVLGRGYILTERGQAMELLL